MEHKHTNRLIRETSPYLLQHAHNPVDWYAWGEEAFARAKAEDRPILLSIGYSACHWCHVMERESFENEAIRRKPRDRQCGNEGGCSGKSFNRYVVLDARSNEVKSRIGNSGRPCIGDQRNVFSGQHSFDQLRRSGAFVVIVVADFRRFNPVMAQEDP